MVLTEFLRGYYCFLGFSKPVEPEPLLPNYGSKLVYFSAEIKLIVLCMPGKYSTLTYTTTNPQHSKFYSFKSQFSLVTSRPAAMSLILHRVSHSFLGYLVVSIC